MEQVRFPSRSGLNLAGVIHRPEVNNDSPPLLIVCHGFRGCKEGGGHAVSFAEKAASKGFLALRFDFAGTGGSEGNFQDLTLDNNILDLEGAVDYGTSLTSGKVVVVGRSFGGTTAICCAAEDQRIVSICTWASPGDLEETFIAPASELLATSGEILKIPEDNGCYLLNRRFFQGLKKHRVTEAVSKISPRSVFVIHGTSDKTVSFEQGVRLFEAAREPKQKLFIEGADHRFTRHYHIIEGETLKWIGKFAR